MNEVEVGAVRDAIEQRVLARPLDLVPADVGERRRTLEPDRPTGQDTERHRAILVAPLEQELEPEADPEERAAGGQPAPDRRREAPAVEARHRRFRRPDARHDQRIRPAKGLGIPSDRDVGADGRQRLVDAHEIAGAVIDHRDPWPSRRDRHPRVPFVDATPSRRGSGSQAIRRARPSALNAASAR